jgi:tRNA nucleotidyltransferase/poly(A) polymerase
MADEKRMEKARETFHELLTTEKIYVAKLHAIKQIRVRMLEKVNKPNYANQNIMKKEIQQALDPPGLESIRRLHEEIVLPEIKLKYESGELLVGSILNDRRIAPFFKVYSEFLSRKETNCDSKITKIQKDAMYKDIYQWVMTWVIPDLLEQQVLNLDSLLLEPVQRLPR